MRGTTASGNAIPCRCRWVQAFGCAGCCPALNSLLLAAAMHIVFIRCKRQLYTCMTCCVRAVLSDIIGVVVEWCTALVGCPYCKPATTAHWLQQAVRAHQQGNRPSFSMPLGHWVGLVVLCLASGWDCRCMYSEGAGTACNAES